MSRLSRIAGIAVLVALSAGAHAQARLDPARVFDPSSGSFLAALSTAPRSISLVTASIFSERAVSALAFDLPRAGFGYVRVSFVNLSLPQQQATFEPLPAPPALVNAPAPSVPQSGVQLSTPVAPAPAPQLGTPAAFTAPASEPPHFGSYAPYTPALTGVGGAASVPVRLGNVRFETAFAAMQRCGTADESAACAQGLSAGTAFDVRAGKSSIKLSLESGVTHTVNQPGAVFPYVPLDPEAQAGLTYPGVSDVFGQNVGAQLAVPVTRQVTVGLQFDRAHYQGNSALSTLPGFEGMRDEYLGNLTYQLHGSSAITFSARQYRYQDLLTPSLSATQTRADLNFTVKF